MQDTKLKALITGFSGFVGSHLAEYLLDQGLEIIGVDQRAGARPASARVSFCQVNLREREPIGRIFAEARPDMVFHLAAQAHVPTSFSDPAATLCDNIVFELNVFHGILDAGLNCPVLVPGSNEEYGHVRPEELPINEENPLRPTNPYAVSKVAQDFLGYQYSLTHNLNCIRMRPFNHTGPRQQPGFVIPSMAKQVAEAEAGRTPPVIKVGNLEAERDFTDVRDIVRAYHLAVQKCEAGQVYNLGSGRGVSIGYILDFYLAQSRVPLTVQVENERIRPWDNPKIVCDAGKFRNQTGWEPRIPLEQTLADVLNYWREETSNGAGI